MELQLKRLREKDIYTVMNWRMLPEVSKHMYTDPKITKKSQLEWFKRISQDDTCIYWIIEFDGNNIGLLYLYDIDNANRRCFWGYYIADQSFRGKGIGRNLECNIYDFVFYQLDLKKLCCEVFEDNELVIKIHQKYGSKIEGRFIKHVFKNNGFHTVVRMAIFKDEWDKIRDNYDYTTIFIEKETNN